MLILNKKSIEQAIQPEGMIDAVKQALIMYEAGDFLMPDRMHVNINANTLLLMPAFADKYFGTKLVSVFPEKLNKWITQVQKLLPKVKIIAAENSEELVLNSDIIVTATTSNQPVLPDIQDLYQNKLILAFGSYKPDMKELPDGVFSNAQIFTDTEFAKIESGDLAQPLKDGLISENQIHNLAKVINNKLEPDYNKTIIFKSVGMALFDITVSSYIYDEAIMKKLGLEVDF